MIPEILADGKLDVEKLREVLAEDATDENERFGLFWPGKKQALRTAQAPTTATLKPDIANSKDWDTTQNVFIEGDNLEVLKILQRHYHNKVKLIYIDPPYNTGKDFVYPDNYKEGLDSYLEWTRQVNQEGRKVSTNSETEGRYHSNWLNMMYPRLKLARNLLADSGVILISIDDNEVANLRRLCDEVFGEDNFIASIVWQKRYVSNVTAKWLSDMHDYVLVYSRSKANVELQNWARTEKQVSAYKNPDHDSRGVWRAQDLSASKPYNAGLFEIIGPTGKSFAPPPNRYWRCNQKQFKTWQAENRIWWGANNDARPMLKAFLSTSGGGITPHTWWDYEFAGHNKEATLEVKKLFDDNSPFDTPKPVKLLRRLIELTAKSNALILDFFAGSSTTAHAVMQVNATDNGNRRFIMVQLPEPTPEDSEARRAGFKTIADISRRRIELAGNQIKATAPQLDTGFRAYKLTDTHFAKWRVTSDIGLNQLEQRLLDLRDSTDDHAQADDLLTEILLKAGFPLTARITDLEVDGLAVKHVDDQLLAYLDDHRKPTLEQLRALVDTAPRRLVMLEDTFHGDDELKTNLAQYARAKDIELWTV